MSETFFPVNDLLRRRLQTGLTISSLTLSVALTIYLVIFGENLGLGIWQATEGRLTFGFSFVLSRFLTFIMVLVVVTGAVIVSFMVFVMMSQRIKDIGLMRASGCPNDVVFGYFMTELLIIAFVGCILGVILGITANYASIGLFSFLGFNIVEIAVNVWLVFLVFFLFFGLAMVFGVKPILDVTKIEPAKAISSIYHYGLSKEPGFRAISKSNTLTKIALRSLFRRKSATIRVVLCLATVFALTTVAIAGGMIADETTTSWVDKAIGRNILLIAHQEMSDQYRVLLSRFYETEENLQFDYMNEKYLIPEQLLNSLNVSGVIGVEARLVVEARVREVPGEILDSETGIVISVGDNREGECLIVGVEPEKVLSEWFVEGEFLKSSKRVEAVVGDSIGQQMFSMPLNQSIMLFGRIFDIAGVCLDPINNGNVTYVPLETLQNATGMPTFNVVMIEVHAADRAEVLGQIEEIVTSFNSELQIYDLNDALHQNLSFLRQIWSVIMFLPFFSLLAACLCLIGYVVLSIAEQRRELGVLRALGMKPKTAVKIVSEQTFIILLSSWCAGIPIGIILTLLILVPEPVFTSYTILRIAGWLLVVLIALFVLSLYPAIKFSKRSILEMIRQP